MKKVKKLLKYARKHSKTIAVSALSGGFVILALITLWISSFEMPDLKSFEARTVAQSTKIYDRTGEVLLFDVNRDVKREVVAFDQIATYAKKATIAIEDSSFYTHGGIQIKAIIRAVLSNLTGGSTQGGSTITQQVIKNSLLTSDKLISRKLKEWILAIRLEKIMTKDEILSIYLNESPYGGSIYGIEEAAKTFFGKKSADVTLAESAYLAAIPNAPTYYSPYGKNKNRLDERKNLVLQKMLENSLITKAEYDSAKKEKVIFKEKQSNSMKAPHFVDYVQQYLTEKYGEKSIREDGLKVITTLDYNLEQKAEEIVKKYATENETAYNAENASLVVIDPKTGHILAMVGSRDYFDKTIDGNFNVATAKRQPGSTFKPFVYSTAFDKGYTPETILFDLPTEFQTTCDVTGKPLYLNTESACYMPENYDGKYLGPMTLRDALAQSRNIPSIKLLYLAGIKDSIKTAVNMGITSLGDQNTYGLTLVLGGGEVSLLELTSAYGVFANSGIRNQHVAILKVTNSKGQTLEEFAQKEVRAINEESANKISDILSDNTARTPAYGANSPLNIKDRPVAVKTGTTNDYRDVWIVGYTPNLVVGAWAGNNDNSPMVKKTAGMIISPMWRAFMDQALPTLEKEYFPEPEKTSSELKPVFRGIWQGYDSIVIDKISGKLATELTPEETREELFIPNVHEILYWVDKDSPWGPVPEDPTLDPQFKHWEYPVQNWLRNQYLPQPEVPTKNDDVHTKENIPDIKILEPKDSYTYQEDQRLMIQVSTKSTYAVTRADFYLNDTYIGNSSSYPFLFSFVPKETPSTKTNNTLKIVVTDAVFNHGEEKVNFNVSR